MALQLPNNAAETGTYYYNSGTPYVDLGGAAISGFQALPIGDWTDGDVVYVFVRESAVLWEIWEAVWDETNGYLLTSGGSIEETSGTLTDEAVVTVTGVLSAAAITDLFVDQLPTVSQADAEAGTATDRRAWTAERVAQAIAALAVGEVVEDTTPQLGGDLDVNGNAIVSTSDGDITLTPNGTGDVVLGSFTFDADQTVGAGQDNYVLTYDNSTGKVSLEEAVVGDVTGPLSSTDNAVVRWDGTGGDTLQDSGVTVNDSNSLTVAGDLVLTEKADHTETPAAGSGYLWVRSDSPSSLIFTDDAGTDLDITAIGGTAADIDQYDIAARLTAGTGAYEAIAAADLTEEATPAVGDFLLGWESGGALRKFDIGDLPTGGGSSGLTQSAATVTDSNVSAAVNYHYVCTIAGMTANRNVVIPTGNAGDKIRITVLDGDADYELLIIGDATVTINGGSAATEWSRLFIAGESVELEATSATNWQVIYDGRIPCVGAYYADGGQTVANATLTQIDFNNSAYDVDRGFCMNYTTNDWTARRASTYSVSFSLTTDAWLDDNEAVSLRVLDASSAILGYTDAYSPGANRQTSICNTFFSARSVGDELSLWVAQYEGGSQTMGTSRSFCPQMHVRELL